MRTISTLATATVLAAIVATAWAMTQGNAGLKAPAADRAGMVDTIEMMKNAKDLPATNILDYI